jgi:hypothetical protein
LSFMPGAFGTASTIDTPIIPKNAIFISMAGHISSMISARTLRPSVRPSVRPSLIPLFSVFSSPAHARLFLFVCKNPGRNRS